MKTKEQILEWLDKQSWKNEFYESVFLFSTHILDELYDIDFIENIFDWAETKQGITTWNKRNDEYKKWYDSENKPLSWKEYCVQYPITKDDWCIEYGGVCEVFDKRFYTTEQERDPITCVDVMSKDHCEAFVAYMKLFQLRNAWVQNRDGIRVYKLIILDHQLYVRSIDYDTGGLSFPTRVMAEEFMETFKDLLEVAKPLL